MRNKYNCISVVSIKKVIVIALFVVLPNLLIAQEDSQAPSIQTGVTFQWSDNQNLSLNDPATIQSVNINGLEYNTFVVPTSYRMTNLGPDGNVPNRIRQNGTTLPGNSGSGNWLTIATTAFQNQNLNHYFTANPNGRNICSDSIAALTTDAQKQTIFYSPAIPSNADAVLAVTERGGNNCFFIKVWGTPAAGGLEQKLGETFVRNVGNYTGCNFQPPVNGSDYWRSGRCNENGQTIGIGLFYLDAIAETGSKITKIEFIAASRDHGDGKFFILQKYAVDQTEANCLNNTINGDLNQINNVPENSTYSLISGPSPAGQSFTLNPNGTYNYVPSSGFVGDVIFDYEVCLPAPNTSVCDQASVTLTYNEEPASPEISVGCSSTNNFTISVTTPLGEEYEYSVNNGAYQTSPDFTNLSEGTYVLKVKNKYTTCEIEYPNNPFTLTNLEVFGTVTDVPCTLGEDGAIDITASGGAPPYTYSWNNTATSEDLSNILSGTYTVTVTDTNGCNISVDFTVNQPAEELTSSIASKTDVLCYGDNTGDIDLTINGGTAPYTVLWNNSSTEQDQTGLIAGDYTVTITDANGCTATNLATISEPVNVLTASVTNTTNVDCNGNSTGTITAEATGGTSPYQYSIDNGTTNQPSGLFENLIAGNYTILITDANGCTFDINGTIGTDDIESPEITVPTTITLEGCSASDITTVNSVFVLSNVQSGDIESTFASNPNYNASDDFNIQSITYIDIVTSIDNCPITVLRTFTVNDNCGNSASASQTIIVQDTTPPTITAPTDITIECTEDETSASTGLATGTDSCGSVTITQTDAVTEECGNTKTIIRTWTATDDCGNTATDTQRIIVEDTTPPTISAPADITIECTEDETSANTGLATGTDSCGSVTITQADAVTEECGNTKTIIRTWTATDDCGNTATDTQTIIVEDTTAPTFTVPENLTIECDVDASDLTITGDVTDEADNCSTALDATFTDTVAAGNCTNESV
ncbi:Ig-like domain-containing protein, partial [uncultured Winogradskyella sp.]|uniref:Ig-like domain-containing protein n=2 Tax=Winogradskyella TaxID=286104 RepID=UPI0030DC6CAB